MIVYTLNTKQGKTMQFYIKAVAELYEKLYGGQCTQQIVPDRRVKKVKVH